MSHPLLVEAAETLFVPVLVHNNKKGVDETILKKFKEPSWNNPVIRFVDGDEKDVIARKDGVWTTGGVAGRMLAAIDSTKSSRSQTNDALPEYLRFVAAEENGRNQVATFAMHCYWQGEVDLGGLAGVKQTKAAWLQGKEVVEVVYDPKVVSYEKLIATAKKLRCASTVFARTAEQLKIAKSIVGDDAVLTTEKVKLAKASDQRFYLKKTPLQYLPLTPMQATKINSAIFRKVRYDSFISPRQAATLKLIVAAKDNAKVVSRLQSLKQPDTVTGLAEYEEQLSAILQ